MQLDISRQLRDRIEQAMAETGRTEAEVIREALSAFRAECGRQSRELSETPSGTVEIPRCMAGRLSGWELAAVLRWAMDRDAKKPATLQR